MAAIPYSLMSILIKSFLLYIFFKNKENVFFLFSSNSNKYAYKL